MLQSKTRERVQRLPPRGPAGSRGPIPQPFIDGPFITWPNEAGEYDDDLKQNLLGPEGPVGDAQKFRTIAVAEASIITVGVQQIEVLGYYWPGDCGRSMYFNAVEDEPDHEGKLQSTDGQWWELGNRYVNERMFGAMRDGTHDDYPACQAVADYLKARGNGKWKAGEGMFLAPLAFMPILLDMQGDDNPSIKLPSRSFVEGQPNHKFLSKGKARGVNGYLDACFRSDDIDGGTENITLRKIHIQAASETDDGGVFMAFKGVENLKIEQCFFGHTRGSTRGQSAYCKNVTVVSCVSRYEEGWTKETLPLQNGNNNAFEDGWRGGSGTDGLWVVYCDFLTGDDTLTCSNERAETAGGDGDDIKNVYFMYNILRSRQGHSLRIFHNPDYYSSDSPPVLVVPKVTNGVISRVRFMYNDCEPHNIFDGIGIGDYSGRRAIEDVVIEGNYFNLGFVVGNGATILNTAGVTLKSNIFHNFGQYGAAANDSVGVQILGNTFRAPRTATYDSVIVGEQSHGYLVDDNDILDARRHAISVFNSNNGAVTNNRIKDPLGQGIHFGGTTTSHYCSGNRVNGGLTHSIGEEASCSNGNIVGNDLTLAFAGIDYANRSATTRYERNLGEMGRVTLSGVTTGAYLIPTDGRPKTVNVLGSGVSSIATGATQLSGAQGSVFIDAFEPCTVTSSGTPPSITIVYH